MVKTIAELIKELEKYPGDCEWWAYEGEQTGLVIGDKSGEVGFIPDPYDGGE